jgi:rRNA maturation protein Rpf1
MSSFNQHIRQAQHNIEFLESFYESYKFNDWAITVSFYTAIHIVEAAIAKKEKIKIGDKEFGIQHSDQLSNILKTYKDKLLKNFSEESITHHFLRNLIVKENFPQISSWFKLLYNHSRIARYREYQWENYKIDLVVKTSLKEIIEWANKEIGVKIKSKFVSQ